MSAPPEAIAPFATAGDFHPRLRLRRIIGASFATACFLLSMVAVIFLTTLLVKVLLEGGKFLSFDLLSKFPSQSPADAGIKSAFWGTVWLVVITAIVSISIGMATAVYLHEFAPKNRLTGLIHLNIANLAGVPSIVYGILGMAVFVRWLTLGHSVLAGALTLSLLILPVIVIASYEALVAVPSSMRAASFALGATRWQTTWHHILPAALPGALTGVILALARAIGETAPLIMIGAVGAIWFVPGNTVVPPGIGALGTWLQHVMLSDFTAMPIQIYDWSGRPQKEFQQLAASTIIVLLAILLSLNAVAASIRAWRQRVS
ncbi:MAG: phosphate ABC transporter permease PstA [Phycisphaerae bacterium]